MQNETSPMGLIDISEDLSPLVAKNYPGQKARTLGKGSEEQMISQMKGKHEQN